MNRHIKMITDAFLIVMLAMSIMQPIRAIADSHGYVNISGYVSYQPRNWDDQHMQAGSDLKVDLYEHPLLGSDILLASTFANNYGNYVFYNVYNWYQPDSSRLNIYLQVKTIYSETSVTKTSVTNIPGTVYYFNAAYHSLYQDGYWTIDLPINSVGYQAIWIFEDIRKAWHYVNNNYSVNGNAYDPGNVTARWETNQDCYPFQINNFLSGPCGAFTYAGGAVAPFIFIGDSFNHNSLDTIIHETGHMFMYNANRWWYFNLFDNRCHPHYIYKSSEVYCAMFEGWADFFPLMVNGDQCYNLSTIISCQGRPDIDYFDLEVHSITDGNLPQPFNWGDTVGGRVAAALYDLYDANNEGIDSTTYPFSDIARITLGATQIHTFIDFWNSWVSQGHNYLSSGETLNWNTINYAFPYSVYLPSLRK